MRKDSEYRRTEFARRRKITVEGQAINIVAPEDLILSKLFWARDSGSETQLLDVRNLLKTVKKLNRPYLARWAKRLGIGSLYKKAVR